MKKELRLLDEPEDLLEKAKPGLFDRQKDVKGLCRRIGVVIEGDRIQGSFEDQGPITRAWRIARECYIVGLFDASIVFSSIAVECAVNKDTRMKEIKENHPLHWLQLNRNTLIHIKEQGLPYEKILEEGESLLKEKLPLFVERRNKVAHGDYGLFLIEYSNYLPKARRIIRKTIVDVSEFDALDQFKKCSVFLEAWVKQNPELVDVEIL